MAGSTKRKTSITLSADTAKTLDRLAGKGGNRSAVIERAIRTLWEMQQKAESEARDRQILESNIDRLNDEAEDVLTYQVDL
jgi:metal-responsive CopG/Arc/MetJ family transcriptional regulator